MLVFVEELDAVISEASGEEALEEAGAGLGAAVEEGVPAADIRLEPVELADAIPEMDNVFLAGAAAVLVGGAAAEESAEDAVLHMEHRHVLVESELKPLARSLF